MAEDKVRELGQFVKQSIKDTAKLLWRFKWYIAVYIVFYLYLLMNYMFPSPKNYYIWVNEPWYKYEQQSYLGLTKLMLIIFALIFFIGTSNMRNHPLLAKLIFLSSLGFLFVFLQ